MSGKPFTVQCHAVGAFGKVAETSKVQSSIR
jgi:hypothetical protein